MSKLCEHTWLRVNPNPCLQYFNLPYTVQKWYKAIYSNEAYSNIGLMFSSHTLETCSTRWKRLRVVAQLFLGELLSLLTEEVVANESWETLQNVVIWSWWDFTELKAKPLSDKSQDQTCYKHCEPRKRCCHNMRLNVKDNFYFNPLLFNVKM